MNKAFLYVSPIVAVFFIAVSCDGGDGGAGSGTAGAGVGSSTGTGPSSCGEAFCAAVGAVCGNATDACGQQASCGLCRYSVEDVTLGEFPSLHISATETLVSYIGAGSIMLAKREGGAWVAETAATIGSSVGTAPELAVGPDGTRWIAFSSGSSVSVAWAPPGGSWTTEEITGVGAIGLDPDIAIAPDGSPVIVFGGNYNNTPGAFIARRSGGAFEVTNVATTTTTGAPRNVALALRGDEAHVVFIEQNEGYLGYAWPEGGTYKVETIDSSVAVPADGALSMIVDGEGRPHVLYGSGEAAVVHAVRDAAWTTVTVSSKEAGRDNALAIDAKGDLHAAFYDDYGLVAADRLGDVFLQQQVNSCHADGNVDMAIDPAGQVVLVYECASGVKMLTRTGTYPAEFGKACDTVTQALCDKACSCAAGKPDDDCCVFDAEGSVGCSSSNSGCFANRWADVCDATREPEIVIACEAALSELACTSDVDSWGAQVPAACNPLF